MLRRGGVTVAFARGLRGGPERLDHVGGLLGDHGDGGVGVAAGDGREDGGVDNPEALNSIHPVSREGDRRTVILCRFSAPQDII